MADRIRYNVDFNINQQQINQLRTELQSLQKMSVANFSNLNPNMNLKDVQTQLASLHKSASQLETAFNRAFNTQLGTVNLQKLKQELNKIGSSDLARINQDLTKAGVVGTQAFQKMSSAIMGTNLQLRESHQVLDKIGITLANSFKWSAASSVVNRMTNSVQSAWNYTKALDSSLNDIRIVTGKSADEMDRFAITANRAAQRLGNSTKDFTNASLIYYQQGLSDIEAQTRAEVTLKAANVTGQSTSTVSEQLTSVWNGYNVSVEDSEKVIDKLAAVAASTASDLEELSTGMSKVASAANIMGVDIDQLNAQLATIVSVTRQAPESVGTALKTIYARMGDIEAGLDSETTLGNYTEEMAEMGINVLDSSGKLRNMGEVIEEVGNKWSSMSREQQVALSQTMAGTRQYNNLLSLFNNWDMYESALKTSKNSLGTLEEQNQIFLDRTTTHLQQLETAWERVFDSFVDNKGINNLIDIFTNLTLGVANFTEALGGGGNVLLTFGSIATQIFNKQIAQSIQTSVKNLNAEKNNIAEIQSRIEALQLLQKNFGIAGESNSDRGIQIRITELTKLKDNIQGLDTDQINTFTSMIDKLGELASEFDNVNEKIKLAKTFLYDLGKSQNDGLELFSKNLVGRYLNGSKVSQSSEIDIETAIASAQRDNKNQKSLVDKISKQQETYYSNQSNKSRNSLVKSIDTLFAEAETMMTSKSSKEKIEGALNNVYKDIDFGDGARSLAKVFAGDSSQFSEELKKQVLERTQYAIKIIQEAVKENEENLKNLENVRQAGGNKLKEDAKNKENDQRENLNNVWNEQESQKAYQSFVKINGAVTGLASGLLSIKNIGNIWSNENLSSGEKFLQITMAASMGLGQFINSAKVLKTDLPILYKGMQKYAFSQLGEAAAAEISSAANMTFGATLKGVGKAALSALAPLAPYILAVAAVAGVIYAVTKAYNADKEAAEKAAKKTEELTERYKEIKDANEKFTSSLSGYKDAVKNMQQLDKKTVEYKKALIEANEKALDLLKTNKELAKYAQRDKDGLITFSEQGLNQIEKEQTYKLLQAQLDQIQGEIDYSIAQQKSDLTDFRRKYQAQYETTYKVSNDLGQYGEGNIDLWNRPKYKQEDGSISTVESISFWDENEQKEILVPLIQKIGDNVVELTAEEAERIYKETKSTEKQYLGKFDNAAQANIYAQKLHEGQEYYYTGKNRATGNEKVSEELINEIAQYMKDNNISQLIPEDLAKISGVAEASSAMQQSILDNIDAYSQMGNQLNNTKDQQKLLADECTQAYIDLKREREGDNKPDSDKTDNEKIQENTQTQKFKTLGGAQVNDETVNNYRTENNIKKYKGYSETFRINDYTFDKDFVNKAIEWYKKEKGYSKIEETGWDWLANSFKTYDEYTKYKYDDNGNEVEDGKINLDELTKEYARYVIREERYGQSKDVNPIVQEIDKITNNENVKNSDIPTDQLRMLLSWANGEGDHFNDANKTLMNQDQATKIKENFDKIREVIKSSDSHIWEAQGFADADAYVNALEKWINERASQTDISVLGKDKINSMDNNTDKVVEQSLSGDLTTENQTEEYKTLKNQLSEIKDMYPELTNEIETFNTAGMIGTQQWYQSLYNIQEKLNELKLDSLNEEFKTVAKEFDDLLNKYKDESGSIDIEAALDDDDFQSKLNNLLDKSYAIDVEIHAQAEDAFDTFVTATKNMATQAAKIGENYVVAADDIRELNNAFPDIINGMEAVGDGSVKLKDTVVQNAMAAAESEMQASAQSTLKQLEGQAKTLKAKQQTYQSMGKAAMALAKQEGNVEENKAKITEGFEKLKDLNNEATANKEKERDEQVATNSNENASILAKNWSSAYESAANSAIAFAQTAVSAHQVAVNGEGTATKGDFSVTYQGNNGKSSEAAGLAELESAAGKASSDEDWESIANQFFNAATIAGRGANDIKGMIAQIGATSVETGKGLSNVAKGKGSNPKKGSEKEPDKMDKVESDIDRYHKVNAQLDKIGHQLDKIQSQEKKFIGTKLINNLNGQLEKLDKRIDNLREKQKIAYGEADELKKKLSAGGVTFNDDGTIANYEKMYNAKLNYVNGLVDRYNGMSKEEQENFKETIEQAKKDFEQWQKDMDRYDELVSDFIPGLENDIQDAIDEEIEINIKKFNLEFEVKLDIADAQKDWNEFKRKILDDIDDDDILGNARARATDDLGVYLSGTDGKDGLLGAGVKQTQSILKELKDMDEKGWSNVYGDDRVSALEDLQEAYQNVEQSLMEIKEIQEDVAQAVLDQMDAVVDAMDKVADLMDTVDSQIEHDIKVIEMVYGETDYDAKGKYMEQRQKNNLDTLGTAKENRDYWEQQMNLIDDKTSEAYQKAQENFFKYNDAVNDAIEKSIEDAQEKAENAIDGIFKKYNDEITNGKGLDYTEQQWELVNDVADQYLDTVNAAFGIRQLEGKWKDAIDQTDNIGAQRKLNALMEEQLKKLREKDKLTKYDIERAEKEYEIALKKLALEEAQQTKSTMRLRRDSQGNYRYEYVADEDQIAKLQDELDVLENSLYNFDKERWLEMQNQVVDAVRDRQDAIKEILMDASLTEEERLERLEEINRLYNEKIQNITDQAVTAQTNLYDSGATELSKIWDEQGKDFQDLSDEEQRVLIEEMLPQFETGVNDMIDKFSGPGGFEDTTTDSMDALSQATQDYQDDLGDVEDQAGITFDEIRDGQDDVLDKMPDMIDDAEEYVDVEKDELSQLQDINAELQKKLLYYQQISVAAKAAATEAYNYWLKEQQIAAEKYAQENAKKNDNAGGNNGNTGSGGNSGGSGNGGKVTLSQYDAIGVAAAISLGDNYGGWGTDPGRKAKLAAKFTNDNDVQAVINRNGGHLNKTGEFNAYKGKLRDYYYDRFNTGGYTGEWTGNYGKLGILDSKELVLNAHDTENMLDMLAITRDVVSMAGPRSRLSKVMTPNTNTDVLEQNVHIEANFPNVESAAEIKEALNQLVNLAAQRASRNSRG